MDFPGYTHIVGNGNANLWLRGDIAADGSGDEDGREPTAPSPWREAAGTLVACALIAVFAWQMRTAAWKKRNILRGEPGPPATRDGLLHWLGCGATHTSGPPDSGHGRKRSSHPGEYRRISPTRLSHTTAIPPGRAATLCDWSPEVAANG